jgi:hypothetical protein
MIECMGKATDCELYDKVVGLAAARIIVYSDMITQVTTPLCSQAAKELLESNSIQVKADKIVTNILNKDRSATCPMELKAQNTTNNKEFFLEIRKLMQL